MTDLLDYPNKKDEQTLIKTDIGKRKKEQFIQNLREGDVINDFFAVKISNKKSLISILKEKESGKEVASLRHMNRFMKAGSAYYDK